jgi:hypothetical protein
MPSGSDRCLRTPVPSGCCAYTAYFDKLLGSNFDSQGPYDVNSIMHYSRDLYAIPGRDTLTAARAGTVVPATIPSFPDTKDGERICRMYPSQCPRARTCQSIGCPATCVIRPRCNNPVLCGRDDPPPCCDPDDANRECNEKRSLCTARGCDFLKG